MVITNSVSKIYQNNNSKLWPVQDVYYDLKCEFLLQLKNDEFI